MKLISFLFRISMQNNAFLPESEKHVKSKVSLLSWSPKLDLLAVACLSGELLLYRLVSRERIWGLVVPESGESILSLCWRPDGKVIALGYSSCKYGVRFVYMEKAEILWQFSSNDKSLSEPAALLKWTKVDQSSGESLSGQSASRNKLSSSDYLPEIPSLSTEPHLENSSSIDLDEEFSILLICSSSCTITLMANGILPIANVCCDIILHSPECKINILDVVVSSDLQFLCVTLEQHGNEYTEGFAQVYDLTSLNMTPGLYSAAAQKASNIVMVKHHVSIILDNTSELCDTVIQEVETQLVKYLDKISGDDFMQLLIWGNPTTHLKHMLQHCITKKGIKKMAQLVQSSYAKIQQLLIVNFQTALDSLYYDLTEICGMVCGVESQSALPFFQRDIEGAIACTGSLMLKAFEMLQVIGVSLKNFEAFFHWLFMAMVKVQEDTVQQMGKMTQAEIDSVSDFIYENFRPRNFQGVVMDKGKQFHLEKVYQYLEDAPLKFPVKNQSNEWFRLVEASSLFSQSKFILQPKPEVSLRQLFNTLNGHLQNLLSPGKLTERNPCELVHSIRVLESSSSIVPKSWIWFKSPGDETMTENPNSTLCILFTTTKSPWKELIFLNAELSKLPSDRCAVKAIKIECGSLSTQEIERKESVEIISLDVFNEKMITMLLQENIPGSRSQNWLVEVSLSSAICHLQEFGIFPNQISSTSGQEGRFYTYGASDLPSFDINAGVSVKRALSSKTNPFFVATSGMRKVSCILSSDLRHISPFVLDHAEEDEEAEDAEEEE